MENSKCAEVVERDPSGRFSRYSEVLGRGSFKVVYKGFDTQEGIEVAWNKVNTSGVLDEIEWEKLFREVQILRNIHDSNIISCSGGWRDSTSGDINFITEYFTSGTLREYCNRHRHLNMDESVRKWGRNIISGLVYLHSMEPPIIHRDLKCDNVFVNGHCGEVKIADMGLATLMEYQRTRALTVIGTPEFMAPELYDEEYDEKVDIYAFGMCLLELATRRCPYDECENPAQIFKSVDKGRPPNALQDVTKEELLAIIKACIDPDPKQRPSAQELLGLKYFTAAATSRREGFQVSGKKQEGSDTVLDMQLRVTKSGEDGKARLLKFVFDTYVDTANAIVGELTDAFEMSPGEVDQVVAKLEYRLAAICGEHDTRAKYSTQLTLVRVPHFTPDKSEPGNGVKVEPKAGGGGKVLLVQIYCLDRPKLAWDFTDVLRELDMDVKTATLSTTEEGYACYHFEVILSSGSVVAPGVLENRLLSVINP